MGKLLLFAFVLSPGVLFAFLRTPEAPEPTLTLAAQTPCPVAAVRPPGRTPGLASAQAGRSAELVR